MALPILTSTDVTADVPLACDADLRAANPPRVEHVADCPGGACACPSISPLAVYADTGDPDGLVVPETASVATVRALSKSEYRAATLRAGRHSERDERAYVRVLERTGEIARERLRAALETIPEPARGRALARLDGRIEGNALDVLDPEQAEAVARHMARASERDGTPYGVAIDDLDDAAHAAFLRYSEWRMRRNAEVARVGVLLLTVPPHAPWVAGAAGFPVEPLLRQPDGEDIVAELAEHVTRVTRLGKAVRPSSGGGSGSGTSGRTAGPALTPPDATAGSTPATTPSTVTGGGC